MPTWLSALNTAKLWSEGSTMNWWRGRAFTSPWWPCRAKETRLWTRKLDKVGWEFGQSLFYSTKSLPWDDFCTNWDHESGLILSLGLVADKEEELPGRLSRAGSYRASLRYCTWTSVSNCLSCVHNIHFCCPDWTSKNLYISQSCFPGRSLHLIGGLRSAITTKISAQTVLLLKSTSHFSMNACMKATETDNVRLKSF